MSGNYLLEFHGKGDGSLLLPHHCNVAVACYESCEIQKSIVSTIEELLCALALTGMDLSALDGVTVALDVRETACALQHLPEGMTPLEMTDHPETMELARTVAVKRGEELRFHIVLRAGLGLMALSAGKDEQSLLCGCFAHEAAHVEHEGHLYKTFPELYVHPLECGDRSRRAFIKALDVWSEYSACRSSALLRPGALEDFDSIFCRAFEESRTAARTRIADYRDGGCATEAFQEIQQAFGDAFISAGYLLGHLHGLELYGIHNAPQARELISQNRAMEELIGNLERILNELWLSEFAWKSIEVFAPIYELLCEMMALYGMAFARHGEEWRVVMSDEEPCNSALKDFLLGKAKKML